jgi:hypothetical protein
MKRIVLVLALVLSTLASAEESLVDSVIQSDKEFRKCMINNFNYPEFQDMINSNRDSKNIMRLVRQFSKEEVYRMIHMDCIEVSKKFIEKYSQFEEGFRKATGEENVDPVKVRSDIYTRVILTEADNFSYNILPNKGI